MKNKQETYTVSTRLRPDEVKLIDAFARRECRTRCTALMIIVRAGISQTIRGGVAPTNTEEVQA